jgi:lysophospholipase L1-like esterase
MFTKLQRPLAIAALFAMAACSNASTNAGNTVVPSLPSAGANYAVKIVGVGDSLTAGMQSSGTLGMPATNPNSPLPGGLVPPTQENGFFALLFAQANGIALDPSQYNLDTALGSPSVSPLPLIKAPGLGSQLLFNSTIGLFPTHLPCDAFNQEAYSLSGLSAVRANPSALTYDLGVPGLTMHEAVAMTAPLTGPPPGPNGTSCPSYATNPSDPTAGALQALVQSESENFYPILGTYTSVQPMTELNVALSLKPSVTTVWLGANDLLKYIFSLGASPATDSAQQFASDLTSIVTQLKTSGSKVLLANLPTVLKTPQFFVGGNTGAVPAQSIYYYLQVFSKGAITPAQAGGIVGFLAAPHSSGGCDVGSGGYLTESGFFTLFQMVAGGTFSTTKGCQLDAFQPGAYLTDTFAAQAGQLNAAYNSIIGQVALGTGTPLVDINGAFNAVYTASNTAPYYYVLPGTSDPVDLRWGGGVLSFDGLHPSTVGYALIANTFISAADTGAPGGLGMAIPPVNLNAFYPYDPYRLPGF